VKIELAGVGREIPNVLRAAAVRRLLLFLSRFSARVRKVTVRIGPVANPLGGVDQICRMRARMIAVGDIRAEAMGGSAESALERAAARLATRVAWALAGSLDSASALARLPDSRARPKARRRRAKRRRARGT
jgi:hypothetical protein